MTDAKVARTRLVLGMRCAHNCPASAAAEAPAGDAVNTADRLQRLMPSILDDLLALDAAHV
jgi:hypothetical protein